MPVFANQFNGPHWPSDPISFENLMVDENTRINVNSFNGNEGRHNTNLDPISFKNLKVKENSQINFNSFNGNVRQHNTNSGAASSNSSWQFNNGSGSSAYAGGYQHQPAGRSNTYTYNSSSDFSQGLDAHINNIIQSAMGGAVHVNVHGSPNMHGVWTSRNGTDGTLSQGWSIDQSGSTDTVQTSSSGTTDSSEDRVKVKRGFLCKLVWQARRLFRTAVKAVMK